MRIALAALLAIHGLIHLLGFLKSWKLAEVPQLTGATIFALPEPLPKLVGLLWLLACLLLVAACAMLLSRYGPWWLVTCVGIIVSQLLVIYSWPEAKAGTLVNIVVLLPALIAWSDAGFQNQTDQMVHALFARASGGESNIVTADALQPLPVPVHRWLEGAGIVGQAVPRTVRIRQRGHMRIAPDKDEVEATAVQFFRVDEPEFIWHVNLRMMGLLPIAGRDSYVAGRGRMQIKLASILTVVDARDEKIDQGALLRFLAETVWFPAAALSSYVHWEPIDSTSARATLSYAGVSGTAVFSFDDEGRFAGLTAERYFGGGPDAKLESWEIEAKEWKKMGGCLVPVLGEVRWKLGEGDFTFYRWELTELEYDPPRFLAAQQSAQK